MASEIEFKPQLRLHRASWLVALAGSIRQMIVPLGALAVFGAREQWAQMGPWSPTESWSQYAPYILPLVLAALLLRALWRQWTFRYGFGPRGLVIHDGFFFRNVRQIEYSRIENIDTERGVLHRLLGVADVRVQTSTGGEAEARISVLDLRAVEEMRARVFTDEIRSAPIDAQSDAALLRLPLGELVRYGLIDNRGMIIVAAVGGAFYEYGPFDLDRQIFEQVMQSSSLSTITALSPIIQVVLGAMAIIGIIAAMRVLSILVAAVTLFDFTLTRSGRDLRVRHGLFTRVALTLRTSRVQAVHETRSLLHRWLGRSSLSVDLTGDHGPANPEEQGGPARTRWLAPVCKPEAAPGLIAAALPTINLPRTPDWRPLAPGARQRVFKKSLILMVLISTTPIVVQLGPLGLLIPLLAAPPLAWLHATLYVKRTAWALTPEAILFRRGWWKHRLSIVPRDRVQSTNLAQSPFDRRWGMASLVVDTAGASLGRLVRIPYLELATAQSLSRELYLSEPKNPSALSHTDAAIA